MKILRSFFIVFTIVQIVILHSIHAQKTTFSSSLKERIDVYISNGQNDSVIHYLSSYLEENSLKEISKDTVSRHVIHSLGKALYNNNEFKQSILAYAKATEIEKSIHSDTSIYFGVLLKDISNSYLFISDISNSLIYCDSSLKILEKHRISEVVTHIADLHSTKGEILFRKYKYMEVVTILRKAEELALKYAIVSDEFYGNLYGTLGNSYMYLSENQNALHCFLKCEEIFQKLENELGLRTIYNNLAILYKIMGLYDKAITYADKSYLLRRKLVDDSHPSMAVCHNTYGLIYSSKQDYVKSLVHSKKYLAIKLQTLGELNNTTAIAFNNIAVTYYHMNMLDSAFAYYQNSLRIFTKLHGQENIDVAKCTSNIGALYLKYNEYDSALYMLKNSLPIFKKLVYEKDIFISDTYKFMSHAFLGKNQLDSSLYYIQKAINTCASVKEDTDIFTLPMVSEVINKPQAIECIFEKLKVMLKAEKFDRAYTHLTTTDTLIKQLTKEIQNDNDKLLVSKYRALLAEFAVKICLKLDSKGKYHEDIFYYVSNAKAVMLQNSLAEQSIAKKMVIPSEYLEEEKQLKKNIHVAQLNISKSRNTDDLNRWKSELFDAREKYEDFLNDQKERYPKYYNLKNEEHFISLSHFYRELGNKRIALLYQYTDSTIFIHYFKNERYQIFTAATKEVDNLVVALRNSILHKSNEHYEQFAMDLSKLLLPMSVKGKDIPLVLMAEGMLTSLSFEALMYSQKDLWLDKFDISYSFSPTLWTQSTYNFEENNHSSFLGIAPVFDKEQMEISEKQRLQLQDTLQRSNQLFEYSKVAELVNTEAEVIEIQQLFLRRGLDADILLRNRCTEDTIKEMALNSYRYIHFATHGFVNMNSPELSGIMLSTSVQSESDGLLFLGEIMNLSINARLVNLSACETGLGKISKGEGLIGLSRTFTYIGAKNVLVSLWKVSDISTKELMVLFYKEVCANERQPLSTSLRIAKQKLRKTPTYSAPYYWSPFIMIGH